MTPSEIADCLERNAHDIRGEEYFRTADLLDKSAATIRAQAEALKIATEAMAPFARAAGKLDGHWSGDDWRWNNSVTTNVTVEDLRAAYKALARIKEV